MNLSCPNIKGRGIIAQDARAVAALTKAAKRAAKLPLMAKLSPNVTDIREIAKAAEGAGADAVCLVNTFPAMAVDINQRRPILGNTTGGLSGPAIKPIALKMVWDAHSAVKIPIVGIGGIMTAEDAIEFILCGATAIQVGTANFVNPRITLDIIAGIKRYFSTRLNNLIE